MKLFIKPHNEAAREFYKNHGHFHDGDAGLDLYVLEDITFQPGETKPIKLGISCEPEDGRAYYLFPRSSISKTPLRMSNSIGLIDGGYRGEITEPEKLHQRVILDLQYVTNWTLWLDIQIILKTVVQVLFPPSSAY